MKKLFLACLLLLIIACKQENKIEEKVATIPVAFEVERFDKMFYESDASNLVAVKAKYPFLFPEGNEDSVWLNKLNNPLLQDLYKEVKQKYPTTAKIDKDLEALFQHIQYYFPKYKTPRVIG